MSKKTKQLLRITEDFTPSMDVVSIKDESGADARVTDSTKEVTIPSKLIVVVEATHTGINRNKVMYTYDKLERSVDSWLRDYNKPVLLNHNMYSDPLGRVVRADFKESVIDVSKHTIQLSLEITNKSAIERFMDGRYKTFSIGGYASSATCSICGKDMLTDGFCGHRRGKTYDGKEAYWILGVMDYDEISVVNAPADVNAVALSYELVDGKAKDSHNDKGGNVADMFGDIDNILDKSKQADSVEDEGVENTNAAEDNNVTDSVTNDVNSEDNNDDNTQEDNAVVELQQEVLELKESLTLKDANILQKDIEVTTIAAERDAVVVERDSLKTENEGLMSQNVNLAKFAHNVMAEKLADLQIITGIKDAEEKTELTKEYSTFTSVKISEMVEELMKVDKTPEKRDSVVTANPYDGQQTDGKDDEGLSTETPGGTQQPTVTLKDYADTLTGFLAGRE